MVGPLTQVLVEVQRLIPAVEKCEKQVVTRSDTSEARISNLAADVTHELTALRQEVEVVRKDSAATHKLVGAVAQATKTIIDDLMGAPAKTNGKRSVISRMWQWVVPPGG